MMVSRAASDVISPIPIRQLNPSGLMTGSMARPTVPATLCSMPGALAVHRGQVRGHPQQHRHQQNHRAGAPQKDLRAVVAAAARWIARWASGKTASRAETACARCAESDDFKTRAVATATRKPRAYSPSKAAARALSEAEQLPVGQKRRDDQGVDRQARRTGHERRDQDGGRAVALVLDGARGQDRRHRAGVGRKQRDERFALQPHLAMVRSAIRAARAR